MFQLKFFQLKQCIALTSCQCHINFRYVRTISRRGIGPTVVKGEVKTIDDGTVKYRREPSTYDDFIKEFKKDASTDVLDIEKDLAMDCEFGNALIKSPEFYAMHESEVKQEKSMIKKDIIQRKYFKMEKETNLLTHAAKEQIRYLHKMNPTEWTPEVISQSFPISVKGVKKLLRSNFSPKTPERIKQHDADVAKKWDSLKSGNNTSYISPVTQKLWMEGKLVEDNYKGNPHLPSKLITDDHKVIEKATIHDGEYSSIIKKYIEYKQKASSNYKINSAEKQLCKSEREFDPQKKSKESKYFSKLRYAPEEMEDFKVQSSHRNLQSQDEIELQHGQFKENLLQEKPRKQDSQINDEYQKWVEQQSKEMEHSIPKTPCNKNTFSKIQKYETQNQTLKTDQYDYPKRNPKEKFKGQVHIPKTVNKKGYMYKKGNCVYDDDGEILFKLPY